MRNMRVAGDGCTHDNGGEKNLGGWMCCCAVMWWCRTGCQEEEGQLRTDGTGITSTSHIREKNCNACKNENHFSIFLLHTIHTCYVHIFIFIFFFLSLLKDFSLFFRKYVHNIFISNFSCVRMWTSVRENIIIIFPKK